MATATLSKAQFDSMVEKFMGVKHYDVEVSADSRGIALMVSRLDVTAEAVVTAVVKAELMPGYVRAEATGEVKYKVSVVRFKTVGEIEYATWWT